MALRKDEEYVLDCLVRHHGGPDIVHAEAGEDPPDGYLVFRNERIAVEVTRLSPVSYDENGNPQNQASEDRFGINVANTLNLEFQHLVPSDKTLLLKINVPVPNGRIFRKKLKSWVSTSLPKLNDEWLEAQIAGIGAEAKFIRRSASGKAIVGIIMNQGTSADIGANAKFILQERILHKETRMASFVGTRWLALLNDYWLADGDTYGLAFKGLANTHSFARIYVVTGLGQVTLLS